MTALTPMTVRVERLVVDHWFRDPPPLIAAMAGRPTLGATRAFVLQWTKFSRLFPRWVGSIISNCTEFPVIAYLVENLMSEVVRDPASQDNHYELLVKLGAGVGLSRQEIESEPVLPESAAMFEWLWQMARRPDWLAGFVAVNGLEILGDSTLPLRYGVAQGAGLAARPYAESLGLQGDALEFFEVSDAADAGHGSATVRIIAAHTEPGREEEVLGVLRESMERLRRMMDAMWRVAVGLDGRAAPKEVT
jgi:pyrroloquinoline quinone (PQQ) biosynthesis protein C